MWKRFLLAVKTLLSTKLSVFKTSLINRKNETGKERKAILLVRTSVPSGSTRGTELSILCMLSMYSTTERYFQP